MEDDSHIESWTADEVVSFLKTLELEQYGDDFQENGITGDILIHLDHEALREIGVESVGHRLAILRAVYTIKVSDNVAFEPEHYVPATVEAESNAGIASADFAKDLVAITEAIQLRDERIQSAEAEIKRLTENLTRLKDQLLPVFKIVKELQPLPTPEVGTPTSISSQTSLSRKFSTKKLFLGSAPRQPSPTHTPPAYIPYGEPESPRSPNKYFDTQRERAHTPINGGTHQHTLPSVQESSSSPVTQLPSRLPAPPRPPPPGVTPLNTKREMSSRDEPVLSVSSAPATTTTTQHSGNSSHGLDAFKSFRVGLDDPCSKVLPAALKKYRINSDWREYSLFICYADQERCLGLDEKPLLIFQELQRANKSPVFMLRKQESGTTNVLPVRGAEQELKF